MPLAIRLFVLAFLFSVTAKSQTESSIVETIPTKDYLLSMAPAVAYSPTYGILVGGSLFRHSRVKPGYDFSSYLMSSFKLNLQTETSFKYHASQNVSYVLEGMLSTFFTPYYGEGDQTKKENRADLATLTGTLKAGPEFFLSDRWSLWPHADLRARDERTNELLLPDERTVGVGLALRYRAPAGAGESLGQQHQWTVRVIPALASTYPGAKDFAQTELDLRFYWGLYSKVTLATRLLTQVSFGTPSYLFRSSLGGNRMLRGFYENRFRGRHVAVLQEEARFPIWDRLTGVLFLDAGDVTDTAFDRVKVSYGAGLRFALPPDDVAKVRLDLGFSEDQVGAFFMFGDTF